ncbi:MAG TPA: amidohydrolase family protein [bacterium]|nr:amidohydrolase family protein [bacterium]
MDIVIRNARLRGRQELADIGIAGGRIERVEAGLREGAAEEFDAAGDLTAPAFVEPHIHLDKALTADRARENRSNTFEEAIEIMQEVKRGYTVADVADRAERAIRELVRHGVGFIRSYVDVDSICDLTPLRGVLAARERCRDLADVELIAFPQEGILRDSGTDERLRRAVELGAEVIGGMPHAEWLDADAERHIDLVFEIARRFDRDVQMHVDESDDPGVRTLQYYAVKAARERYFGRCSADHVTALAAYDDNYAARVIDLVRRAQMHIVTLPTKLMRGGARDKMPMRRGLTRVRELLDAGVNVAYGQDVMRDGFLSLFGTGDPLQVGFLLAFGAQMHTRAQIETLYDMATVNGARLVRLPDYGLTPGCRADVIVVAAPSPAEAYRTQPPRRLVVHAGRVVARDGYVRDGETQEPAAP